MNKRILLFDIDGTLTRSVKTVEEDVFQKALGEIYGKKIEKKDIVYSGGTDRLIWKWLLDANDIEYSDSPAEISKILSIYKRDMLQGIADGHWYWQILKNVNELLEQIYKEDDLVLALLTGNMIETAEVKLTNAGVKVDFFKTVYEGSEKLLGGFGSDNMNRPTIVKIAMDRIRKLFDFEIPNENFLIIGDTPKDIYCGHANRIPVLAVATGIYSAESLATIADNVLEDFSDINKTIEALRNTKLKSSEILQTYELQPRLNSLDP